MAILLAASSVSARAQSATWFGGTSSVWSDPSNWSTAFTFPNEPADVATFDNNAVSFTPTISGTDPTPAITLGGITINPSNAPFTFRVDGSTAPASLSFAGAGVVNNTGVMQNFVANPTAGSVSTATFTFGSTNTGTTIISSSAGIHTTYTLNGGGSAIFTGTSLGGTAAFVNNGGTFDISQHTGGVTVGSIAGSGTFSLGANTLTTGADNTSTNVTGVIQDGGAGGGTGGSLSKVGNGTLTISGTTTYSGSTTINAGAVLVNGSMTGGSAVTVNSGTTLGGTGTMNGSVNIASGGNLTPGPGSSPGTLTTGALTLNTGSNLNYQLGAPGTVGGGVNSLIIVNGDLTLAGTLNITALPGFATGAGAGTVVYQIIDYSGQLTNNGLTIGTARAGYTYQIDTGTNNVVNLDVSSNGQTVFWNGPFTVPNGAVNGGTGTWDNTTTNWTDASGTIAGTYNGMNGVFEGTAGTVTLGANITFTTLEFVTSGYVVNADAANTFSLSPTAGASITTDNGVTATINAPIIGTGSITTLGGGTLILGGNNTYSGATTVTNGTLQAGSSTGFSPNSAFTINTPGILDINGFSPTIGSLAGTGTVTNNGAAAGTLTTGNDGTTTSFTGIIQNGASPLALTKIGVGTMTIDDSANTTKNSYTGGTILANGGLIINSDVTLGNATAIGTGPLTITSSGGPTLLGTTATPGASPSSFTAGNPNTALVLGNTVNIEGDFSISNPTGDIYFAGPVNLNPLSGTANTITGLTPAGQIHFSDGIFGANSQVGLSFIGGAPAPNVNGSQYSAFIIDGSVATAYTGLTTIGNNAFVVLEQNIQNSAIIGNILINPGGSLDLLASQQTAPTITLTDNSTGILIPGGGQFQGFELQTFSDTIGTLNGTGTVGLGTGILTVSAGNFSGNIVDSQTTGTIQALQSGTPFGTLQKVGPGTLTLSGVNTYSSSTSVLGGTLQAGSSTGFSPNSAFTVATSAILDVNGFAPTVGSLAGTGTVTNTSTTPGFLITGFNGANTTFTGSLQDGAGPLGLVKTGTGIFTITNSTYSGSTTVVQGTLQAGVTNAFSSRSAFTVNFPGVVDLNGFNNSIGSLGGTGTVTNLGSTPVVLTTGLDNTDSAFGGTIQDGPSSSIALVKTGSGAMVLVSPNTFTGGTILQGGALVIANNFALGRGNVTVVGGALQAGGAATDINVGGNYKQTGGELDLRLGGTAVGTFDRLAVVGSATLGGRLSISSMNGFVPKRGESFTVIDAAGGVNGKFQQVTGTLANNVLMSLTVEYLPNDVVLDFGQPGFSSLPNLNLTPNQKAVAFALDNTAINAKSTRLMDYLNSLPVKSLPAAFDRIAPEEYAAVYQISTAAAKMQATSVENRLDAVHATHLPPGAGGPAGPPTAGAPEPEPPEYRFGVFANGSGEFVSVGDSSNAAGYNFNSGGVTFGADYRFSENFVAGALFNYTRTRADLTENGRLDADAFRGGLYASLFGGGAYVNGFIGAGYNDYDIRRQGLDTVVHGDTNGGEFNALIATGYDVHRGSLTYGPVASLQYTYTGLSSLNETGSLDPLNISSSKGESIRTNLGVRASYEMHVGKYTFTPELRATWQHECGDTLEATTANMLLGSPNFSVTSSPTGRDSLLLNVGFTLTLSPQISVYLFYDAELGRFNYQANNFLLGVRSIF